MQQFSVGVLALLFGSLLCAQIDQGPGGPILVLSNSANPFTRYYAEILRSEGFNEFLVADITTVSSATLANYDVVIAGDMALTSTQAAMLSGYVNGGGNLIAMRPDKQLAGMLGLADAGGTLAEGYLLMNTGAAPAAGLVAQTIQFHGTADRYAVTAATTLATLYATATSATSNPAVTLRAYGSGQAAAFTYDLARSVVYTRQGNPVWAGLSRYHAGSPYPADLLYGWTDPAKTAIPQADEQMRLLANLIQHMNRNKKPLPRFWYLPFAKKFALIMTSDDHGTNATASRFDGLNSMSPAGCVLANWECARATAYVFPSHPAAAGMGGYQTQGHEISLHFSAPGYYTAAIVDAAMNTQLAQFKVAFPALNAPISERGHGGPGWNDYASQAVSEARYGIRLDHNFQQDPYGYYNANPGFFTGSAMLMRFAQPDGTMIDNYQAATQIYDGNGSNLPSWAYPIFDRGIGAEGNYGFVSALIHSDYTWQNTAAFALVAAAQARGIPVITSRQAVTWLDGRNNSSFSGISWSGSRLSFNVSAAAGANGLRIMLPATTPAGPLSSVLQNGSPVGYTVQTIKGVDYAFVNGTTAGYQATYGSGTGGGTAPSVSSVSPTGSGVSVNTTVSAGFSQTMNAASFTSATFTLRASGAASNVPAVVSAAGSNATLTPSAPLAAGTIYTATISSSVTNTSGLALGSAYSWSFTTAAAAAPPSVTGVTPSGSGVAIPTAVVVSFSQNMNAGSFGSSTAGLYTGGTQLGASLALSGATLTITPSAPLQAGTTYTVNISGLVTNTLGVAMSSNYTSSFNTASAGGGGTGTGTGPAAWWNFNENLGTTAGDFSGNGNILAVNGATWTTGYTGSALAFNAGAGIASLAAPPAALNNHTAFTWAAWVRPTGEMGRGIGPIIERGSGSDLRRTLSFGPVASSAPGTVFATVRAGGNASSESALNSYSLNTWAHWAITYDDAGDRRIHIYRNGVEVAYRSQVAATGTLTGDAGTALGIGATPASQFYGFTGAIDDVRLYARVLTAAELAGLVGGTAPPGVVSYSPTGASVGTTLPATITFDRTMNSATFNTSTFTLRAAGASSNVPATVTASGATATLTPGSALAAGTTYTATVASGVTDTSGVPLGANFAWNFTTATVPPPVPTSWSPTGTNVSLTPVVSVNFNRTLAPATFTSATFYLRANGSSANVPATVSAGGVTATLTPTVALSTNTTYVATVAATVTDSAGVALGSTHTWTFTTGAAGPVPVGSWSFNEGTGTLLADASGNGNNGTVVNATFTGGRSGTALAFNGANSVVNLGTPASLTNLSSFTWSAWVMATGEMGRAIGPVLEKGSGSNQVKSFSFGALQSSSPRTVQANVRAGSVNALAESVTGVWDLNVWAHWTITYDDAGDRRLRLYKNGVEVAYRYQTPASGALVSDAGLNLAVGATPDSQFFAFNGVIDEVRIFPRALTPGEVQALAAQ